MVDAPVALVQRVGQRRARGRRRQPHVKKLGLIGRRASFNVAQRLAPGELRPGHDAKKVGTAQCANTGITLVPIDDAPQGLPRHVLHHLREQYLAYVHAVP